MEKFRDHGPRFPALEYNKGELILCD